MKMDCNLWKLTSVFLLLLLVGSISLFFSVNGSLTGLFIAEEDQDEGEVDGQNGARGSNYSESTNYSSDVPYDKLRAFLEEDNTDEREFTEDYVCQDFANDLVGNALEAGIPSCTVFIGHDKGSHSLVAFRTEEKGIVFVEPQTGEFVLGIEEGEDYCELAGWQCNWEIEEIKHCFE